MDQTGQIGLHFEPEHAPFIKWVNYIDLNITRTHLTLTYDLFINGLVMSNSRVVSDFVIPKDKVHSPCFSLFNKKLSH